MQEQPQLVGCGCHAGRPVDGQTGFPAFEMVFRLSAAEADVLVEHGEITLFQVGDDAGATKQWFCAGVSNPSTPIMSRATMRPTWLQLLMQS